MGIDRIPIYCAKQTTVRSDSGQGGEAHLRVLSNGFCVWRREWEMFGSEYECAGSLFSAGSWTLETTSYGEH
jgi:hypothetical protein